MPDETLGGDLLLMVAAVLACVPVFVSGTGTSRIEGGLFVTAYGGYLGWLLTSHS